MGTTQIFSWGSTLVWQALTSLAPALTVSREETSFDPSLFPPAGTGGAAMSAPGWLELEFGGQRLGGNGFDLSNGYHPDTKRMVTRMGKLALTMANTSGRGPGPVTQ
jgi:hypothetical protein